MEIGQIFSNKYKILSEIGQGGGSKVYLAEDVRSGARWAVKELYKDCNVDCFYDAMLAEAKMISGLQHPGIPRIVDFVDTKVGVVIVMDYIEGQTMSTIIQEKGMLSQAFIIDIAKQLVDILDYVHSKDIIFRDLKPANIMLCPDGKVMLIDFGIACRLDPYRIDDTTCLGTVGFAAPEQYHGEYDYRTDIYAFGATLFNIATGVSPAERGTGALEIRKYNPWLSAALEYIVLKCAELDPKRRYQSFQEVSHDINNIEWLEKRLRRRPRIWNFCKRLAQRLFGYSFCEVKKVRPAEKKTYGNSFVIPPIPIINQTVVLSNENYYRAPSVLENQNVRVFLSYCHADSDLADIICEEFSHYDCIKISRYSTDVPYKGSFTEFMNTLGDHDKVIMIISDSYLKSHACMYEVGRLMNSPDFQSKIVFVVCSNNDKGYYKVEPQNEIQAKLYSLRERNQYIIHWQNYWKELEAEAAIIEDDKTKIDILKAVHDIKRMIADDIRPFMQYIAEVNGVSFSELYKHNFEEFYRELGIKRKEHVLT